MTEREFVLVPRDALIEFMGEIVTSGGSNAHFGLVLSRIEDWIDGHDLSDLYFNVGP